MDPQRYPISTRLAGVIHKEKEKFYLVSVLWSDQNDIMVYRSFRDFQKLHKQMKKAFPTESKRNHSERVIPKFRYRKLKRREQRKTTTKYLQRFKFLQKYCNELLSCEPRVCQCTDLVQFFQPNKQDLQPEFFKNSIMVMPLDEDIKANEGGGDVTKPFVTETYRCVAAYEIKDTKNKPFKVAAEENVDVLIKDKAGWWLVENDEKRMAWFPAPYLEKPDDSGDEMDGPIDQEKLYTAIKSYTATKDDEISVIIGAVVEVIQKPETGWWLVRYKEKAGYIPSIYLRPQNYPRMSLTPHLTVHQNSTNLEIPTLEKYSQISRSQGNLLEMPSSQPVSPHLLQPESKHRSHSLSILTEHAAPESAAHRHAPPTITVELDDNEEEGVDNYSRGSFDSQSDFSFSDDMSCSSGNSSPNLGAMEDGPRFQPPTPGNHLLSRSTGAKMMLSVSDPNLYKGPASPKVPPRPRPQQILARCTTITRKNAAKGNHAQMDQSGKESNQ
ncbi:unnamed protein product [Knipowitschia caucasica]